MPSPVRMSRRTALAASLAATAVLAGCDIDPPADDRADPTSTPPPPEDRDLVLTTAARISEGEALAAAAAQAFPELDTLLTALVSAHAAHRSLLVTALPDDEVTTAPPPRLPRRARRALMRVRSLERQVLRQAEDACTEAASGDLARVLASIAASTAQHLTLIDAELSR